MERAEQAALRPGDEATFRERMEELDQQRQQVLAAIGALSQERAATLEQVQALKTQLQAVNEAVQQLEHEQAVKLPRVKYAAGAALARTTWPPPLRPPPPAPSQALHQPVREHLQHQVGL